MTPRQGARQGAARATATMLEPGPRSPPPVLTAATARVFHAEKACVRSASTATSKPAAVPHAAGSPSVQTRPAVLVYSRCWASPAAAMTARAARTSSATEKHYSLQESTHASKRGLRRTKVALSEGRRRRGQAGGCPSLTCTYLGSYARGAPFHRMRAATSNEFDKKKILVT